MEGFQYKRPSKPKNQNTSGPLFPNTASKDANASTISTHGVAKDSAFALANAQRDHTIAFHADNKPYTQANRTSSKVRAKYWGTVEVKMSSRT